MCFIPYSWCDPPKKHYLDSKLSNSSEDAGGEKAIQNYEKYCMGSYFCNDVRVNQRKAKREQPQGKIVSDCFGGFQKFS